MRLTRGGKMNQLRRFGMGQCIELLRHWRKHGSHSRDRRVLSVRERDLIYEYGQGGKVRP